jgi:dihydrofolate reductase
MAAKTQYYTATTLDGFIADENNSLSWLFESDSGPDRFKPFFAQVGALAMGRTTYEWILEHDQLLENPLKWADHYGDTPAWVFSNHELSPIPGANLHFVRGDVRPVHEAMTAAAAGRAIWLVGGGELVGQFADAGLLDEIIAQIAPVTLGAGAPLLPRRLPSSRLTLTGVEQVAQFAFLTYEVS